MAAAELEEAETGLPPTQVEAVDPRHRIHPRSPAEETQRHPHNTKKGPQARPLFLCAKSGAFSNAALAECNLKIPKTART